jgi:hypothetical protein
MGLLKTALIGAAVYGAIKYLTKKDMNGRSMVDDIKEKAPEWMDKVKNMKREFQVNVERQRH